jgi:hypothetical protein
MGVPTAQDRLVTHDVGTPGVSEPFGSYLATPGPDPDPGPGPGPDRLGRWAVVVENGVAEATGGERTPTRSSPRSNEYHSDVINVRYNIEYPGEWTRSAA